MCSENFSAIFTIKFLPIIVRPVLEVGNFAFFHGFDIQCRVTQPIKKLTIKFFK